MATYITGAAMMEPDVRVETNRLGFCHQHFEQIPGPGQPPVRGPHFREPAPHRGGGGVPPGEGPSRKRPPRRPKPGRTTAFICENIEKNMVHLTGSTLQLWQREEEFRRLYAAQPCLCLPHYAMVLQAAAKLPRKAVSPV